jgi:hypothetical protein
VDLHLNGGMALLLWSNGGEIGIAFGDVLHLAKIQYDASLKAEKLKQTPAKGSRSILWGHFKTDQVRAPEHAPLACRVLRSARPRT